MDEHFQGMKKVEGTILGCEIRQYINSEGVMLLELSQTEYINMLVTERFPRLDGQRWRPYPVPWVNPEDLSKDPSPLSIYSPAALVNSLAWCRRTKPEIAGAVSRLGSSQSKPEEFSFQAAEILLRYLFGKRDNKMTFRSDGNSEFVTYCDASLGQETKGRSRGGSCVCSLVVWWRLDRRSRS
eukprot:gb/GEZN01010934.1/.p1 GENE.gb/GEZN01010934.1/~~gb/GEZN01010934.1/.p1  ORF type:complete len:183 (-),score=11.22 gb/GEZN01010934.1/:533-1081(-)